MFCHIGVVPPSPACARALSLTTSALQSAGHTVTEIDPPSPFRALQIASQLLNADGCRTYSSFFRSFESNDPGAAQMSLYMSLPRPIQYIWYLFTKYIRRDPIWADLLRGFQEKSSFEQWKWVAKREAYKAEWHTWWNTSHSEMDFFVCPVNATPAVPHKGMRDAVSSCGYTFLFNLLDYSTAILPITKVNAKMDEGLPEGTHWRDLNGVGKGAYKLYDVKAMEGLPVAVQVVGRRLTEESVLGWSERVFGALKEAGTEYQLLEVD